MTRKSITRKKEVAPAGQAKESSLEDQVQSALEWLKSHSTKATLDGMARYAIPSDKAFGVAMKDMKALGKQLGRNHELAAALWDTGVYEARMVCSFVDDPARSRPRRWTAGAGTSTTGPSATRFASTCSTAPRTPGRRSRSGAAGATSSKSARPLRCCGVSPCTTRDADDEQFVRGLALIERAAGDERNFVKKAVNMALRAIGKRNRALNAAAVAVARRLAASQEAAARWVGKDALGSSRVPRWPGASRPDVEPIHAGHLIRPRVFLYSEWPGGLCLEKWFQNPRGPAKAGCHARF